MEQERQTRNRQSFIILAALILNTIVSSWYFTPMIIDAFGSNAYHTPLSIGSFTLPPVVNHIHLLWPIGAALFSAVGVFKRRGFQALGIGFGLSFALFMSALMVHHYTDSLEYDPNRMGGIIETALMWTALFAINSFAAIDAIKRRQTNSNS